MPGTVPPTVPSTMDACARVAEWISALACSTIDRYPVESDGACACSRVCADGPPGPHALESACLSRCLRWRYVSRVRIRARARVRRCSLCVREGWVGGMKPGVVC